MRREKGFDLLRPSFLHRPSEADYCLKDELYHIEKRKHAAQDEIQTRFCLYIFRQVLPFPAVYINISRRIREEMLPLRV